MIVYTHVCWLTPLKSRGLWSGFRTRVPSFLDMMSNSAVEDAVTELKVFGVVLHIKLTFKSHLRILAVSASVKFDFRVV